MACNMSVQVRKRRKEMDLENWNKGVFLEAWWKRDQEK